MITSITRVIVLLALMVQQADAQTLADDIVLIRAREEAGSANPYYNGVTANNRNALQTRQHRAVARYNPVMLVLRGTMAVYQHVISPQLSRSCPYEITCSNFSKLSIQEYGIIKGVFLSADRILRCNRIGILDVHPLDFNEMTGKIADPPNKYQ